GLKFLWSASSSCLLVGFVSSGSYSYPCMRPQSQQQFDQCDQRGRGTWATANCRATATIGFLARGACGEGSFSEDLSPFYNRFVIGLEADQTPGQFHQRSAQARIAMFGDATLQARVAATVLSGAEPGITANLASITKAPPIANLSIDDHTGHQAQSTRLLWSGGALQLDREGSDLLLQRHQDRL